MEIPTTVTPELAGELERLQPWMHHFRFDDKTIVGMFKYQLGEGTAPTVSVPSSPPEHVARMQAAYREWSAGDPFWQIRLLRERGLIRGTALDIASASGKFSFALADEGAPDVLGVEIRPEQVEQAQLLQRLAPERFASVRFEHDPTSADVPEFRSGESYDLVLSMGLLYHLTDPVQHLRNLRRLTRGAVLLHTMTSGTAPHHWQLVLEQPDRITKATGGVSWVPHWNEVPSLLRAVGFDHVEIVAAPRVAELQRWDRRTRPSWENVLPVGAVRLLERRRSTRYRAAFEAAMRAGHNARYYTYLAT